MYEALLRVVESSAVPAPREPVRGEERTVITGLVSEPYGAFEPRQHLFDEEFGLCFASLLHSVIKDGVAYGEPVQEALTEPRGAVCFCHVVFERSIQHQPDQPAALLREGFDDFVQLVDAPEVGVSRSVRSKSWTAS